MFGGRFLEGESRLAQGVIELGGGLEVRFAAHVGAPSGRDDAEVAPSRPLVGRDGKWYCGVRRMVTEVCR